MNRIKTPEDSMTTMTEVVFPNDTFKQPARLGDILTIKAKITRAFNTSMEVHAEVWLKRLPEMKPFPTNEAYFIFVALDGNAKPTTVPPIKPVSMEEKRQFAEALKRRENRFN